MCILCILIPVLVGLICALLGYLLGRLLAKKSKEWMDLINGLEACRKEREKLTALNISLSDELESWKSKFGTLQDDYNAFKLKFGSWLPLSVPFNAEMAAQIFGKNIKQDDLKIVEGIGPVIEEVFHKAGVMTWKALAETSIERCRQILLDAGEKFRLHNPESWPKQCELAYMGKWSELKEWQDQLLGGRV
jgi:hypothetical protein